MLNLNTQESQVKQELSDPLFMWRITLSINKALGAVEIHPTGSAYFFGAGNDFDVLVYTSMRPDVAYDKLKAEGYVSEGSAAYPVNSGWASFRKGIVNIILHFNRERFNNMLHAAKVSRLLAQGGYITLEDKAIRVAIHEVLRNEKDPE